MKGNKDSNRLILVVGDAPAHDQDVPAMLAMIERAHKHPFETGKPAAEGQGPVRPFIVSAIATSSEVVPAFEQIAKAGGGKCVLLSVGRGGPGALLPGKL